MKNKAKEEIKKLMHELVGSVVNIEEFEDSSLSDRDRAAINDFVMDSHDALTTLSNHFKIEL